MRDRPIPHPSFTAYTSEARKAPPTLLHSNKLRPEDARFDRCLILRKPGNWRHVKVDKKPFVNAEFSCHWHGRSQRTFGGRYLFLWAEVHWVGSLP